MVSYLTFFPFSKDFVMAVHFQCCYGLLRLRYLQFSMMQIRESKVYLLKIGDHEIKMVNFADDITIFFNCLTKIKLILK